MIMILLLFEKGIKANIFNTGTIDMDLITTGVSASERMRRENVLTATRNLIMEKLQIGGPSIRILEVNFLLTKFYTDFY